MSTQRKSGIYRIYCVPNRHSYLGSSVEISIRWSQHRISLRSGRHNNPILQHAWDKYGEHAFTFSVLEECDKENLAEREQFWLDKLNPKFNCMRIVSPRKDFSPEMRSKAIASLRARANLITHCPRGHVYDEANTYMNAKGKRICRACNTERVRAVYASETSEQREKRRLRAKAHYERNREEIRAKQSAYTAANAEKIREYKWLHRSEINARRKQSRATESPERRAHRLALKRASNHRLYALARA